MPNYFFTDANGNKRGPLTPPQVRALAAQGIITPETPMETDGGHKGRAGQLRGLFKTNEQSPPCEQGEQSREIAQNQRAGNVNPPVLHNQTRI